MAVVEQSTATLRVAGSRMGPIFVWHTTQDNFLELFFVAEFFTTLCYVIELFDQVQITLKYNTQNLK